LNVSPNKKYAIVLSATGVDATNYINSEYSNTSVYSDGNSLISYNSGTDWTASTTTDFVFKVYGNETATDNTVIVSDDDGKIDQSWIDLTEDFTFSGDNTLSGTNDFTGLSNFTGGTIGISLLGGDATDGASTTASSVELTEYRVYDYDSLTVDTGDTLSFGSNFQNKRIVIKVKNDLIVNGTISAEGMGGAGGAGGAAGPFNDGTDGSNGISYIDTGDHFGLKSINATGGLGGSAVSNSSIIMIDQLTKGIFGNTAAGGGGASSGESSNNTGAAGGDGGAGGGFLYIEVGGDITIGASGIISAKGEAGSNGSNGGGDGGSGGGGGGGAGGTAYILYNGTLTNNGSVTVAGGAGGTAGTGGSGNKGGGAGGAGHLYAGNAGDRGEISFGTGNGGAGSVGVQVLEKNTEF